eukprot:5901238-Ditylum_brightwellii.AAC.1
MVSSLCLERPDIKKSVNQLYVRLLQRGYQRTDVLLIFNKAIHHNSPTMIAKRSLNQEHSLRDSKKKHVYLHMRYHQDNTPPISSNELEGRKWAIQNSDINLHTSETA